MSELELRWQKYLDKKKEIELYGISNNLIYPIEDEIIKRLRNVYDLGLRASILISSSILCNSFCMQRPLLLTLAVGDEDFNIIDFFCNGIILNPEYIGQNNINTDDYFGIHRVFERIREDGSRWIYDTSYGLVFEKNLYYTLEVNKVDTIISKNEILRSAKYNDLKNRSFEESIKAWQVYEPVLGDLVNKETDFRKITLEREVALFREDIIAFKINKLLKKTGM